MMEWYHRKHMVGIKVSKHYCAGLPIKLHLDLSYLHEEIGELY